MSGSTFWTAQDQGLDPKWYDDGQAVRAPLGDAVGDAFDQARSFTGSVFDWMRRTQRDRVAGGALTDEQGQPLGVGTTDRVLTPDEANEAYGIQGQLQFQGPLTETSARELRDIKRAEIARADTMNRTEAGIAGMGAVAAAGLVGSLLDPLNVASAFVPAVGATRAAAWLAQAGSRLGRVGVAARIGAIEGAAGAVLLEPLQYGLAQAESQDYGPADSLLNVAFGAVLGGLLHGAGRAAVDGWAGWRPGVEPETVRAVHEQAVRAAAAQIEGGAPVNVAPLLDAARIVDEGASLPGDLRRTMEAAGPVVRREDVAAARAAADALDKQSAPRAAAPARAAPLTNQADIMEQRVSFAREQLARAAQSGDSEAAARLGKQVADLEGQRVEAAVPAGLRIEDGRGPDRSNVIRAVRGEEKVGGIEFSRSDDRGFRIHTSEVKEAAQRQGVGSALYAEIVRRAKVEGVPLRSDWAVSPDAQRRWAALEKQGLEVIRNPLAEKLEDGTLAVPEQAGPVFSIERWEVPPPEPTTASAPPELVAQVQRGEAVLREHVAAGRITEAEFAALADTAGAEKAASRGKALKAAAACLIGNGA